MLRAVYSYAVKGDRFLMLIEQTGDNSFSKAIIPCESLQMQTVEKHRYMRDGFLESHRFCGGSLSLARKYAEQIKEALEGIPSVLWCGDDEWIAPREVYYTLPGVVLRNGTDETFRPSELGVKPVSVLGGTLGSPDLGFYGD